MNNIPSVTKRCGSCKGTGLVKNKTLQICENCFKKKNKVCYLCENVKKSFYTECNGCLGCGSIKIYN